MYTPSPCHNTRGRILGSSFVTFESRGAWTREYAKEHRGADMILNSSCSINILYFMTFSFSVESAALRLATSFGGRNFFTRSSSSELQSVSHSCLQPSKHKKDGFIK